MEIKFIEKATSYHEVYYNLTDDMINSNERIKKLIEKYKNSKLTEEEKCELWNFVNKHCNINSSELLDIYDYRFEQIQEY